MTDMRRAAVLFALMLGACGGGSKGGAATVPDGGVCGNYPLCLATLMENCLVSGACTIVETADSRVMTFASGVVQSTTIDSATQRQTSRVTTTDGTTTCYTVEWPAGPAGGATIVWRNPAGATVATGIINISQFIDVTCAGDGTARVTDLGECFGGANACAAAP